MQRPPSSSLQPRRKESAKSRARPQPSAFISYARSDLKLVQEFRDHAGETGLPLQLVYDIDLSPGLDWEQGLTRLLEQSRIALFFLSPAALASQYIREAEIPTALRLAAQGRLHVLPVLLRECAWQQTPLAQFMLMPRDARPVDKTRPRQRAWAQLVDELRELLNREPEPTSGAPALPSGADRLLLALCAVLDQPAELALLEHLDESELSALWQQHLATADGDASRALAVLAQRHGQPVPQPLWAAWVATVQPGKLGP